MPEYIFSATATLNSIFNLNHNKQLTANLSCCTFAIKSYSVKNWGRVESRGNFDKRNDIRRKWNVPFSCFWKFRPLDRLDSLREEIKGQKESRQMKISIAASRARANSPPLVERETVEYYESFPRLALFFPEIKKREKSWKRYRASKFFAPLKAASCFLVSILLKPLKLIPRFAE